MSSDYYSRYDWLVLAHGWFEINWMRKEIVYVFDVIVALGISFALPHNDLIEIEDQTDKF